MISDLQKSIEKHTANNPELAIKFEIGSALFKKAFCEVMENEQHHRMTSNVLTGEDGLEFEHEELYVPLGLVERKKQAKRDRQEGQPEKGSELYQYEEAINPISHDTFFNDVLWEGKSKSQGKRIAIIGEPGAGKTTFLQKIAEWILEVTDDVPIWINLGALGQKTIREYLLEDWLRDASQSLDRAPAVWKSVFEQYLQEGKVWLLLDGVDEMGAENRLHQLALQLGEGWAKNVRIVLTCRLNVWEANKNELYRYNFDIYRNLDFEREQIAQFINNWFAPINPDRGHKLNTALDEVGKERILDMVKNPLRLSLLCRTWQLYEGELPDTKAELYRQFVEAHYDWNRQTISDEKRQILNRALGKLALKAIDNEDSRFRLRESFIRQEMEPNLFSLALELGWLNRVGVAIENPGERVYAFYHPTFEEYFAALIIDDWNYFISKKHNNSQIDINSNRDYRIFNQHIKEIALYWIGRNNIAEESKVFFVEALLDFNKKDINNTNSINLFFLFLLFQDRAYSIGIELFAELNKSSHIPSLLKKIVEILCNHSFNDKKYKNFGINSSFLYRESFKKLNIELRLEIILCLFENQFHFNTKIKLDVVSLLEKTDIISHKNYYLIGKIFDEISQKEDDFVKCYFLVLTRKYFPESKKKKAQKILKEIIYARKNDNYNSYFFLVNCLLCLKDFKQDKNILSSQEFLEIISNTTYSEVFYAYLYALSENLPDNQNDTYLIFDFAVDIISFKDEYIEGKYPYANPHGCTKLDSDYYLASGVALAKDIAHKIGKNNEELIDRVFEKIESIFLLNLDYQSENFIYNISNIIDFYDGLGKGSDEKLFYLCLNFLENQCQLTSNRLNGETNHFFSVLREMYKICNSENTEQDGNSFVQKLSLKGNERVVLIISNMVKKFSNDSSTIILSLMLYKIWYQFDTENQEVLKCIQTLREIIKEEENDNDEPISEPIKTPKLSRLFSEYEINSLKESIEIEFQPIFSEDIINLTNYLLYGKDKEPFSWVYWVCGCPRKDALPEGIFNLPKEILKKSELALHNLKKTNDIKLLQEIICHLKPIVIDYQNNQLPPERMNLCFKAIWHCAENMTYPEFYKAWHSKPEIIYPEILEISPLGNTAIAQTLNQQILDLPSQLQPTDKTYPLVINAQSLEDETDNSSIAQEICNQIYAIAFPDETNIPEINNAPQLKRLIPNIKQQLETKNLALIFHNGEPNETLIKFCKKLTDVIYIKWITEQSIKIGIPPQENLVNILQNWINQLD